MSKKQHAQIDCRSFYFNLIFVFGVSELLRPVFLGMLSIDSLFFSIEELRELLVRLGAGLRREAEFVGRPFLPLGGFVAVDKLAS